MRDERLKWAIYATGRYNIYGDAFEPVATFNSEESANRYIKKSKLKQKRRSKEFRYNSLLGRYRDAYVDIYKPEHPPHEPEL